MSPVKFIKITTAYTRTDAAARKAQLAKVLPEYMTAGACPAGGSFDVGVQYPAHMADADVLSSVAGWLLDA